MPCEGHGGRSMAPLWCPEHKEWPPCFCSAKCIDGNSYLQKREPWPSHSAVIFWKMKTVNPLRFLNSNYHLFFQFTHSVMSNSLQPHGLQHARLPCPSPTPRACSNSCSSSHWYYPTIIPFSSCFLSQHQSFFQWVSSSLHVAKVLELQLQQQSFQWLFRTGFL